jgi:hypothetical protein
VAEIMQALLEETAEALQAQSGFLRS